MSNDKLILNFADQHKVVLKEEGYVHNPDHKYIVFGDKPLKNHLSIAASLITKYYLKNPYSSANKMKTDGKEYIISWIQSKTNQEIKSKPVNYRKFMEFISKSGEFDPVAFNLCPMECYWLDNSVDVSANFHFFTKADNKALTIADGTLQARYGDKFPIKPKLDREGHLFTTLQPQLIKRIINARKQLIENSNKCLSPDWVLDLRALINDTISLLEITLTQTYIKAEYSPDPGWTFDIKALGHKNNRRLKEKLQWIRIISGSPLNIEKEWTHLERLRKLRNHMNHFDPPTLVLTIEEAVIWLNDILQVAIILIKIRQALKIPVSNTLINFLIQKEAVFEPEYGFVNRLPLVEGESGYTTSIWDEER